jgi:hypothetical protein
MNLFARKVFGVLCVALFVFACCLTGGVTVGQSALGAVLTFSVGCSLLVGWEVVRETMLEMAAGLAEDRVWPELELAAVVPAVGGLANGMPIDVAAANALAAAEVAAGTLAGGLVIVVGIMPA